jgi:hypothetical protein
MKEILNLKINYSSILAFKHLTDIAFQLHKLLSTINSKLNHKQ